MHTPGIMSKLLNTIVKNTKDRSLKLAVELIEMWKVAVWIHRLFSSSILPPSLF